MVLSEELLGNDMGNGIPKKLGFTWEAFCGKFMGNLLVDMGTSVDNL